jgi:hypothetical protein
MKTKKTQLAFSIVPQQGQDPVLSTTLDLSTLEAHLWEAANILRGPVDAADFKTYIFPLLFFKRISDVYDEEIASALAESGGDQEYAQFPENHRFQIPSGYHWRDIRTHTTNVGQALQHAMREIEKANQRTLYGIFGDAQWTNKERLSDELLINLIDHFSYLPLSNSNVDSDILGQEIRVRNTLSETALQAILGLFDCPAFCCLTVISDSNRPQQQLITPLCASYPAKQRRVSY